MSSPITGVDEEVPDNHVIVLFGATGDLARRKIIPGLYHLADAGLLPRHYRIIGSSRAHSAMSNDEFRLYAKEAVRQFGTHVPEGVLWQEFESSLSFAVAEG